MRFLIIFLLCSLHVCKCKPVEKKYENKTELKELKFPTELDEEHGDQNTLKNVFRRLGISFFQANPESLMSSPFFKLWSYIPSPRSAFSMNWLFAEDPYKDACSYEATEDGSGIKATKRGRRICRAKCKKENDEYVEFLNDKLQGLIGLLADKEGIVTVLEPNSSKISQCVPRVLLTGLDCSCKSNFKIKVNSKLQHMFNNILSERKSEVKDFEERGGHNEHRHHSSFFLKLLGFFIVLSVASPLIPIYLIWWIFFS